MKVRVAYRIKSRMFETPMSNLPHPRLEPWLRCDRCSGLSGCSTVAEPGTGWRRKGLARRKRGVFMSRWCWPECPRHLTLRGKAKGVFVGHESFVLICPDSIGLVTISGGPLVRAFVFFFQCRSVVGQCSHQQSAHKNRKYPASLFSFFFSKSLTSAKLSLPTSCHGACPHSKVLVAISLLRAWKEASNDSPMMGSSCQFGMAMLGLLMSS